MAREVLGIVGAAVGGYFGGAAGAQFGFAVGSTIGGFIDGPDTIKAPGLGEAPIQTGRPGIPIPRGWGLVHLHGNIIQMNPLEEVTTTERQGKGGGVEQETTRRYRTFAIGLMRGPIAGIVRIWENDRLVYDVQDTPAIPTAESTKYAEGFRLYYGTETQLPDPDLEAEVGTDNALYYRGLAYIVFVNKDITDTGSSIPQFRFEIDTHVDDSVTSRPYPIEVLEGLQLSNYPVEPLIAYFPVEGLTATYDNIASTLGAPLKVYDDWPPEGLDSTFASFASTLEVKLKSYEDWPPEGFDATFASFASTLEVRLVTYDNWPPEGLTATMAPQNGTLT